MPIRKSVLIGELKRLFFSGSAVVFLLHCNQAHCYSSMVFPMPARKPDVLSNDALWSYAFHFFVGKNKVRLASDAYAESGCRILVARGDADDLKVKLTTAPTHCSLVLSGTYHVDESLDIKHQLSGAEPQPCQWLGLNVKTPWAVPQTLTSFNGKMVPARIETRFATVELIADLIQPPDAVISLTTEACLSLLPGSGLINLGIMLPSAVLATDDSCGIKVSESVTRSNDIRVHGVSFYYLGRLYPSPEPLSWINTVQPMQDSTGQQTTRGTQPSSQGKTASGGNQVSTFSWLAGLFSPGRFGKGSAGSGGDDDPDKYRRIKTLNGHYITADDFESFDEYTQFLQGLSEAEKIKVVQTYRSDKAFWYNSFALASGTAGAGILLALHRDARKNGLKVLDVPMDPYKRVTGLQLFLRLNRIMIFGLGVAGLTQIPKVLLLMRPSQKRGSR